ncbi:MAG TPA: CHAT domain-containing protein, partial [Thermoanaerobaculia bacterium]|nr:CHAT domain-containing protein [Thermoanaerobaculia bacterium]
MAKHVRPVDLEMRVKIVAESGGTRLLYTLHSPTGAVGFSHREIPGPVFHGRPEDYQAYLLQKIEQLGLRLDIDGALLLQPEIERKLASLGRDLWRELFSAEIRHAYFDIRKCVRSWMIVSDEPWIPWELVKPYEDRGVDEIIDDDFLSCQFELTRWFAGHRTAAHEIVVQHIAAIHTGSDLPQAEGELRLLGELARSGPGVLLSAVAYDSARDLLGFLETQNDLNLLHFVGHGEHALERPEESAVLFRDGSALRPVDLEGPLATRLAETRPLVFQNACWGGQQGWAWTHLGGWASRWVGVCGCGAFLAPLWPARDQAAFAFARAFYENLAGGATLGQAALDARRRLRAERPGDPSPLAYTVYGHPNALVSLGDSDLAEISSPGSVPRFVEAPRWSRISSRRSWPGLRSRKAWLAALLSLGLLLVGAWQFSSLLRPAPPPQRPAAPKPDSFKPTPVPRAAKPQAVTISGNRFEITAGKGATKSSLLQALEKAAEPLAKTGISGWTIDLDLASPQVISYNQDGLAWKSCHLSAHGRAQRAGTSLDLGTVPA